MNFIKIGENYINLAQVNFVRKFSKEKTAVFYFVDGTTLRISGEKNFTEFLRSWREN